MTVYCKDCKNPRGMHHACWIPTKKQEWFETGYIGDSMADCSILNKDNDCEYFNPTVGYKIKSLF